MIDQLPLWIETLFISTFLTTIIFFHFANGKNLKATTIVIGWSLLCSVLASIGFYEDTKSIPPNFIFVLVPATALLIYGLTGNRKQWVLANRNSSLSTFSHIVRVPVEIVLFQLFVHDQIPELMTFEGRNFDILIGISAPIIFLLHTKNMIGKKGLLLWNITGLCFVLFILINGILSAELPFQQFAFNQPNKAVLHFPFILLPSTIVPIVIWTHISDIIKLKSNIKKLES